MPFFLIVYLSEEILNISANTKELCSFYKPLGFEQNPSVKEDDKGLVLLLLKCSGTPVY